MRLERITNRTPIPKEGVTRCLCGSKYWDLFIKDTLIPASADRTRPAEYRCHSCKTKYNPSECDE